MDYSEQKYPIGQGVITNFPEMLVKGEVVDCVWIPYAGWWYQLAGENSIMSAVAWIREDNIIDALSDKYQSTMPAHIAYRRYDVEAELGGLIAGDFQVYAEKHGDTWLLLLERRYQEFVINVNGPTSEGFTFDKLKVNSIGVRYSLESREDKIYASRFIAGLLYGQATQLIGIEPKAALEGKI